jgi:hypothetical protein
MMDSEETSVADRKAPTEGDGTDGASVAFECPYCDRRFARETYRDLHLGGEHEELLDAGERAAYEAAHDAEVEEIRLFRLKALAVLVLVYFGFLVVYAFTL